MFDDVKAKEAMERLIHIEDKINILLDYHKNNADIVAKKYSRCSWSQHGEDLLVWDLFIRGGVNKPSYVDVGANHPYEISNTAIFYTNGCRGINIDPSPDNISLFNKYRPEDINLCCGIGPKNGSMPFYIIDSTSGRNSFDKNAIDSFISKQPEFKVTDVQMVEIKTLDTIFNENNEGICPDYLSMDIEGLEWDVLKCYDFNRYRPKVMTIEIMSDCEKKCDIIQLMGKNDYLLAYKTAVNHTFIDSDFGKCVRDFDPIELV